MAVHDLQHYLTSRNVGETPVHGRGARVDADDTHVAEQLLHLVDRAACAQHQRHELQVGDALLLPRRIVSLVLAVTRKVEESGRQPLLVQSLGHELLALDRQPDIAVAGREQHPVHTVGREGAPGIPPRHDDIAAVQIAAAPFDRAGDDTGPVGGPERDAGAGPERLRHDGDKRGGQRQQEIRSFHNG